MRNTPPYKVQANRRAPPVAEIPRFVASALKFRERFPVLSGNPTPHVSVALTTPTAGAAGFLCWNGATDSSAASAVSVPTGAAGDLILLWVERGWLEATVGESSTASAHSIPAGWWAVAGGGQPLALRNERPGSAVRVHLLLVPAEWCVTAPLGARFGVAVRRGLIPAESPHGMELSRWWRSWENLADWRERGWETVLRLEAVALLLRFEKSLPVARLLEALAEPGDVASYSVSPAARLSKVPLTGSAASAAGSHNSPRRAVRTPIAAGRTLARADELVRHLHARRFERLTVAGACRAVGLHPVYGAALFKQATGFTVLDYLRRLRVNRACELLAATDLKIADVARQSGFATTSRFYEAFTLHAGCKPQDFRRRARTGPRSAGLAVDFLAGRDRLRRFEPAAVGHETATRRRFPLVLWVDDVPENNFTERLFLHEIGVFVDSRPDTASALAALAELRHDLVITDLSRPEGSAAGLDLLSALRAGERARNDATATPLLLYTSEATPALHAAVTERGGQGVFDRSRPLVEKTLELLLRDAAFVESPTRPDGNGS